MRDQKLISGRGICDNQSTGTYHEFSPCLEAKMTGTQALLEVTR